MKIRSRILSLLLVLCMVVPTLVGFTSLEEATETQTDTQTNQTIQPITNTNETIRPFELPDIITREEAISNGYVGRLKSKEDNLYSLVFDNGDGTNTLRLYSHPVKYVDSNGKIKDISLSVKAESDGSFKSASHSVITTFNKKLSDGISLSHEDINVKMVPSGIGTSPSAKVSTDNKAVSYAIDSKTAYVYELTYSGFKEDIVVKEYTGQTEYTFTLYTNGLALVKEDGSYYLADDKGNIKATVGDIIVFTADERNNTLGSMTHETVRENAEYTMTIHLDADYLRDEKTLYPIRIDPTVEIVSGGVAGAIQDATLNSNAGSGGTSGSILVGVRNTYGVSRILMRFPTLSLDGVSAGDIVSATISLRDIMCQSNQNFTVECRIYDTTAPAWTESAPPTFTAAAPYVGSTILSSFVVTYNGGTGGGNWYHFDIKAAAEAWANGTQDPSKGIIFKAADSFESQTTNKWYKTFSSYNRSSYKPSLKITYEPELSTDEVIEIPIGEPVAINVNTSTDALTVTWSSSDTSIATVDANGVVTGHKSGTVTITATFIGADNIPTPMECTVYVYMPDNIFYIKNLNSGLVIAPYNGSPLEYTEVAQTTRYTSTLALLQIREQWRIHYVGQGLYTIRPMLKLDTVLCALEGEVAFISTTWGEETLDTVPYFALFTIEWKSDGYVINNLGDPDVSLQIENASTASGARVVAGAYSSTPNCKWDLEIVPNPPSGTVLYDGFTGEVRTNPTIYVAPEETIDPYLIPAHYWLYGFSQEFTWSSSDTSIASVNELFGEVTGKAPGTVTITATHTESSSTVSYTLQVTGIANGTYYLRNKQTGYYADIEDQTMADGTTIHQWQFHGGNSQKWIFEHQGDGFYTIKSANATAAYYLGVINDEVVVNSDIVLRDDEITSGMEWNVSVTNSGAFKLTAKKGYSLGYALATTTSDPTNGAKLVHGAYVNDTVYRDEWYLEEAFFFDTLIKDNIITAQDVKNTDDGLYILTVSLADILNGYGISSLPSTLENTNDSNNWTIVSNFYDDWYLFAIKTNLNIKYGLYKMREQEFDDVNDNDDGHNDYDKDYPGVTISFVALDINILKTCLYNNSIDNGYNLLQNFNQVTGPGIFDKKGDLHDTVIASYFDSVSSKGSYLIAESFVNFIAQTANSAGIIALPVNYSDILSDLELYESQLNNPTITNEYRTFIMKILPELRRIPEALNNINVEAGYNIYNTNDLTITIQNKENLTLHEKHAILASFTANVTFNSFAAEVLFHADALDSAYTDIPLQGDEWYAAAVRADMGIGENAEYSFFNDYYDLNSDIVQDQIEVHGEY